MDCREVRRLADAYISDQLLVETAQAIGAHLDGCPSCRAEIEGLRRVRASIKSAVLNAPDLAARAEFTAALASRLREEAGRQDASRAPRRLWLALAASAVLAVGAGLGVQQWSARAWTALLLAAAGDHQNCALTFKLAEDPIPLALAAQRFGGVHRLMEQVVVPAATASGGTLQVLDRHSCVFGGQRFVHIVLRYKQETVSVLVTEDPRPALIPWGRAADAVVASASTEGAFNLTSFRGGHHAAFVVSTLGQDDLLDVARAVSGPVAQALAGA